MSITSDMTNSNDDVLGRLNALLNRDKEVAAVAPPPAQVPLLTEIYVPPDASQRNGEAASQAVVSEPTDLLVQAAVPLMVQVVEEVLASYAKPAMDEAISRALVEMQPKIDTLLRQQLSQLLTQKDKA